MILAVALAINSTAKAKMADIVCEGTTADGLSRQLLMNLDDEIGYVTILGASGEVILERTLVSVHRDDSTFLPVLYLQNFDWEPRLNITLNMTAYYSVGEAVLVKTGQKEVAKIKCDLAY